MRNPFKRAAKAAETPPPPSLRDELDACRQAVGELVRDVTQLRLEWNDTLDKITAWANRQAARQRRSIQNSLGDTQSDDQPATDPDISPTNPTAAKQALRRRVFGGGK